MIDQEIHTLIANAYQAAKDILTENMDILHSLADSLLERETVMGKELDELILSMRPGFEFPGGSFEEKNRDVDAEMEAQNTSTEKSSEEPAGNTESSDDDSPEPPEESEKP